MKSLNILGFASLGLLALTACEGGDLYEVAAPDWIAERADSIANSKTPEEEPLEGMMEDVYTIGKTDFTSGWWADFSKYYVIPQGEVWNAVFNVNINPSASNTYKNFALIICSDAERGGAGYVEYGAIRFDHQPSGNSEWGDHIDRSCVESTLTFGSDTDAGVDKLGGKCTLTIDRTDGGLFVKMTNGTVTKTYKHPGALENLNADPADENISCFLVVEGSYIEFKETNIEPTGGCTSALDKQPVALTLANVPEQVLVGTPLEEALVKVTARVEFEEGVAKDVSLEDLYVEAIPGLMDECGTKTLVAIYNKTFKGVNCDKPVMATAQFEVVSDITPYTTKVCFPTPVVLGLEDNTTPWWTYHTENIKVDSRQTAIVNFTNYSNCINNWHNFCIVLNREDLSEYGVVRADAFGWGTMWDGNTLLQTIVSWTDWDAWRMAMDGAKVTAKITNNGDGTADVVADMLGNDGVLYQVQYLGLTGIEKDNLYFRFVSEGSHLVFDTAESYTSVVYPTPAILGAEDNTTGFWGAHTDNVKVEAFHTVISTFTNFTTGENNWNNFCVVLNGEDVAREYGVVRADNHGWGSMYDGNEALEKEGTQGDWDVWRPAMDGAKVTVKIYNDGNGKANIDIEMVGNNGETYTQFYHNLLVDSNDLYFRYTVDGCHLVFDQPTASRKRARH